MMKKNSLLLVFFLISLNVVSQSYIGFLTDNYSGVHGVISNPANIADSRFKTDINLIGASAFIGNDYYGLNVLDALDDDYDFDTEGNETPTNDNNLSFNTDIMGPSFMFNLDKKSSIAVFTRARAFANVSEVNGELIDEIDNDVDVNGIDINEDYNIDEGDFNVTGQAWAEVGVTYAREIFNKEEHFLKGGISLKFIKALGAVYGKGTGLNVDYDADGTVLPGGFRTGSVNADGQFVYGYSEGLDDDDYEYELPDGAGFGIDIGFVYEWRPDYENYKVTSTDKNAYSYKDKNKYKLKLGLSITDIGSIKYNEGTEFDYTLAPIDISEDVIDNVEDIDDLNELLNDFYTLNESDGSFKTQLPTALHISADWNIKKKFYLNLNTDFSLRSKDKIGASSVSNLVSLTPRFESKWFSFYVPLSVVENSGFQAGAGLRAGPLYIGSGSVISALTGDDTQGADVYVGVKIPIYQGKPRDTDEDGIINKLDGCPKVAGPKENNGCPWEDADEDGVLDNVDGCPELAGPKENKGCPVVDKDKDGINDKYDKCPEVAGPEENNGCPWGDKDKDGILDNVDGCPEVAGAKENKGCPWGDKDKDGVLDNVDSCPEVAGPKDNKGCPKPKVLKPTVEVQATLNSYAKTILFNSGKSTIKNESHQVLLDIVKILQEYPSAKFTVEGHTDSVGNNSLNQRLSESRANQVKSFLTDNGVGVDRLSAVGYGESNPIATNATREGRANNRRVEINLVK